MMAVAGLFLQVVGLGSCDNTGITLQNTATTGTSDLQSSVANEFTSSTAEMVQSVAPTTERTNSAKTSSSTITIRTTSTAELKSIWTTGRITTASNSPTTSFLTFAPPPSRPSTILQCDAFFAGKPYLVMQSNLGHGLDQDWSAYKWGFSDAYGGYWLGNEHVHRLTNNGSTWRFCADVISQFGTPGSTNYNSYVMDNESMGYTYLAIGATGSYDFFGTTSRKYKFSTKDRNNQPCCCAEQATPCKGGWWYGCTSSMTTLTVVLNGAGSCGFFVGMPGGLQMQYVYSLVRIGPG